MIDLRHSLAVLASRLCPWRGSRRLAWCFAHKAREGRAIARDDLFWSSVQLVSADIAAARRVPSSDPSDQRHDLLQAMCAMRCRTNCALFRRHRRGRGGGTPEGHHRTTVQSKAIKPTEFERLIVETTVQGKTITHLVDSRLLKIARYKVVAAGRRTGIVLKQTCAKEGKSLRHRAGGYVHTQQFRCLRKKMINRQRTILGIALREMGGKIGQTINASPLTLSGLRKIIGRAERTRTQRSKGRNKLYALHTPEVERVGKGKARKPYEFGVKVSVAGTHKQDLTIGACNFASNPYDGHMLAEQLERVTILTECTRTKPRQITVDLGFRGVNADNPVVETTHRGELKSLTGQQRCRFKRREVWEPIIRNSKHDHGVNHRGLRSITGDALYAAVLSANGPRHRLAAAAPDRPPGAKGVLRPCLRYCSR